MISVNQITLKFIKQRLVETKRYRWNHISDREFEFLSPTHKRASRTEINKVFLYLRDKINKVIDINFYNL